MKQDPATVKGPFVAVLDDLQFGPAETLIGNAILWHRPTKWTRFTAWIYRKRTGIGGELKCRACGEVVGAGWGFWYHQAQGVIEMLRENLSSELVREYRRLADGQGGISTNYKTGVTTSHSVPCTEQTRWVTGWETTEASLTARAAARGRRSAQ